MGSETGRATIAVALALLATGCGGGDPFAEAESAAEAYVEALRTNDVDAYCPRLRMTVFGGDTVTPLPPDRMEQCRAGELFELSGSADLPTETGRSGVKEVTAGRDRASVRLSRGGAMGLRRERGEWVLTCLATPAQERGQPGSCR